MRSQQRRDVDDATSWTTCRRSHRFERLFASLSRLILLDPRGLGCSDVAPLDECFAPEAWATDILAVLDALGIERAVVSGEGYSAHAATQFAVSHPDRTLRLALNNSYARLGQIQGDEILGLSKEQVAEAATRLEREWGTGRRTAQAAPALATDPSFLEYLAARERRSASPATAAARLRAAATSDIRGLVQRLTVPTLVYYTGDLTHAPVEHSRYLAAHIPNAILVEAPGKSFYAPAEATRLSAWAEFIVGGPAALSYDSKLLTLLFTDVVDSTKQAAQFGDTRWARIVGDLDAYVVQRIERYRGSTRSSSNNAPSVLAHEFEIAANRIGHPRAFGIGDRTQHLGR